MGTVWEQIDGSSEGGYREPTATRAGNRARAVAGTVTTASNYCLQTRSVTDRAGKSLGKRVHGAGRRARLHHRMECVCVYVCVCMCMCVCVCVRVRVRVCVCVAW